MRNEKKDKLILDRNFCPLRRASRLMSQAPHVGNWTHTQTPSTKYYFCLISKD